MRRTDTKTRGLIPVSPFPMPRIPTSLCLRHGKEEPCGRRESTEGTGRGGVVQSAATWAPVCSGSHLCSPAASASGFLLSRHKRVST